MNERDSTESSDEDLGLPPVTISLDPNNFVKLEDVTEELLERAFFDARVRQERDALNVLLTKRLITEEQAKQLREKFDGGLIDYFFIQSSQHNIGLRALVDRVLSVDELLSMPTTMHVDYLTAWRETTKGNGGIRGLGRTFDGIGIILLREKLLTVDQYTQLPVGHIEALFNADRGAGLYALRNKLITFDDIMKFPEEKFNFHEEGKLAQFVCQKIAAHAEAMRDQKGLGK
ncbi:MAG TPA: hypothetical protein VGV92_03950 [Gammaproteobacteria bacterium]|nr:hypothetical protein [Gammaproteobacteria bacterium]